MSKKHSTLKSFSFAFQGISETLKNEPNFRIQLILGLMAIFLGIYLNLSSLEWIILSLTISTVLILEMINTSLEALVDLLSPEQNHKAKIAKDCLAGAVLLGSLVSIIVGVFLFIPKIINLL